MQKALPVRVFAPLKSLERERSHTGESRRAARGEGAERGGGRRYSVYLLYWYISTNTDAAAAARRGRGCVTRGGIR